MQKLVTEICKVKNRLSRQITKGAIEKLSRSHTFCEAKHALGQTKFEQQNISLRNSVLSWSQTVKRCSR